MAQHRKKSSAPTSQTNIVVYSIIIVVTVFVVLAVVRYFPSSSSGLPSNFASTQPFELPTEPIAISAEEMRRETEDIISALIADFPNSVVPRKIAAEYALSKNRYDEAQAQWTNVLQNDPQSIEAQVGLATVAIKQGHPGEAVERLTKLFPGHSSSLKLATQLARGLQQTGQLDQAAQVANVTLASFPHDLSLLETAAEIESQRGELQAAKDLCECGLQLNPSNGSLHFILSNINRRLGNAEQADKHLQISRELRPETKTGAGEFEQQYDRSLRRVVSLMMAQAAEFYIDQGDAEQATRVALRATEINPQGGGLYRVLSKILYRQKRFVDAYQVERRLIAVEPNNPLNYVNLSKIAFLAGDSAGGKEALIAAYSRMPGSPIMATALAAFYLEDGDVQNAKKFAEESVQLQPNVPAYQILSAVCARLGDRTGQAEAERNVQRLMKLSTQMDPALK